MSNREEIERAIAALEGQRSVLGDAVVDAALASLRQKLAQTSTLHAVEEQRKQATILFADLSGFTALSEKLDAEELSDTINALWQRLDGIILAHGGVIDKHVGDAVMAVWGATATREDDAERAVRAALAMQAELAANAGEGPTLKMRIGLNTGPVLLGVVGTTGEYSALGDTVNTASRLQNAAPVGGILITHETYRLVRGIFDVQPQQPLTVKGKAEPLQTYLVLAARPRPFRPGARGVEGIETRMVGRDAELATLQQAFWTAQTGSARLVILAGDAGVGKSRLLWEFEKWLALMPVAVPVFQGLATPEMSQTPYGIWRDLFRRQFEILDSDPPAQVRARLAAGLAPHLDADRADLVGQLVGFDFSAAPAVQRLLNSPAFARLAQADLLHYIQSIAADQPLVILLEDLHWADPLSLEFILRVVQELPNSPILVVALTRPALFETRPAWGAGDFSQRIDLSPLTPEAATTLVRDILQKVPDLPVDLQQLIVNAAEGNPFYLEELIKMFIEDGVIVRGEAEWQVAPGRLKRVSVPTTLVEVLEARLDSLPTPEKAALQRAAVVGRIFWDAAIAELRAEGEPPLQAPALLPDLQRRELVFRRERTAFAGAGEYTFKHAILRDVTYETVLLKRRRVYHVQTARWLEAHSGERLSEYTAAIARHYQQGGENELAARWWQRAGQSAYRSSGFSVAQAAFEQALTLLPAEAIQPRLDLLISLGGCLERQGSYPEARQRLTEALETARQTGDVRAQAGALNGLNLVATRQGSFDDARLLGEEALTLARQSGDAETIALALQRLGGVYYYQGTYPRAVELFEAALNTFQQLGNPTGEANCLVNLGSTASIQGDHDRAIQSYNRALAINRQIGERWGVSTCLSNLGTLHSYLGKYEAARRYFEEGLEIRAEIGDRWGYAACLANLGWTAMLQQEYDQAVQYGVQSLEIYRALGDRRNIANSLCNLAHADAQRGEHALARRAYLEALQLGWEIGALPRVLEALAGLAGLRLAAGELIPSAELLGLTTTHPATSSDVTSVAEPLLARLRSALPAADLEAALARGSALNLEATVRAALQETP